MRFAVAAPTRAEIDEAEAIADLAAEHEWPADAQIEMIGTRSSNLGPLSRRVHRAKTHGGWRLEQPEPGVFTWTSPHGLRYQVSPLGSRKFEDHPKYRELDEVLAHAEGPPLGTVDP